MNSGAAAAATPEAQREQLVRQVHDRLLHDLDIRRLDATDSATSRQQVTTATNAIVQSIAPGMPAATQHDIVTAVTNEVLGYGPIQPLLDDPDISEVMVNSPTEIFYERGGVLHQAPLRFRDNAHIMRIAERIVSPLGRRLDEASPMVDARLPDGSRVNIVIPPIAVKSPSLSIRKFRQDRFDMDDLIRVGSVTEQVAGFLRAAVHSKINIVISGGTGSGKTTLLNALSAFIPRDERIVTIEDPIEIQLRQPHVVALEARPPTGESTNSVSQRDLVRNALRMRPDRIIIGEVRGSEAFDMLQAMNTGHEGSITTVHANTPRDALSRIENMVLMAGFDLSTRTIREQMSSALHMIIQISRLADGSRRMMNVTEVVGMEGDVITIQDIFRFEGHRTNEQGKIEGHLTATGIRPAFADEFRKFGASEVWVNSDSRVQQR